jgi:dTDP-4-amino-4,6-dideoxygalactose transaminase
MTSTFQVNSLAIFGGCPSFNEKLYVGRPNIGDRDRLTERINDLLNRRWLTNGGPYVLEFEKRISEFVGAKHCIATCNATIALEIAIRAAELADEVIIPAFTFIATAHALQWQGITPVFCDIDPVSYNIDPVLVEKMITPRTTGIIGVHLWGRPCAVEDLSEIARRYNLKLLFDAAHAFGCYQGGRPIGNSGNAEIFSFHATKLVNSFEGGAVVTNDDCLADKIRLMQNFGIAGYDDVISLGTNGKMSEVAAAMGLTSLESIDEFISINRLNYDLYREGLADVRGVEIVSYEEMEASNYQYLVLEIDENRTLLTRDQLQQILWSENVIARRYFYPGCHRSEPYRTHFPRAGLLLPQTELLAGRVLSLPTGTAVSPKMIRGVCHIIRLAIAHAEEISERLGCNSIEPITCES